MDAMAHCLGQAMGGRVPYSDDGGWNDQVTVKWQLVRFDILAHSDRGTYAHEVLVTGHMPF